MATEVGIEGRNGGSPYGVRATWKGSGRIYLHNLLDLFLKISIFINVRVYYLTAGSQVLATLGSLPSLKLRGTITKERIHYYEYQI